MPIDPAKVPIMVLPGVMGSRLHMPNSGKYWDPDSNLAMLRWVPVPFVQPQDRIRRQLRFGEPAGVMIDHQQSASDIDAAATQRGWGGVAWGFYGGMLKDLQKIAPTTSPVYAFGYDWRQDIAELGGRLRLRIQQVLSQTNAAQLILIAHSMGGLVIRQALAQDSSLASQIRGVLYVFQPARGAVVLYRRFYTGVSSDLDGGSVGERVFGRILGNNAVDFTENMSGLPGPCQLLPGPRLAGPHNQLSWNPLAKPDASHNPPLPDDGSLYGHTKRPPNIKTPNMQADAVADLQDRLKNVKKFHQNLPEGAGHPNAWAICGQDVVTDVASKLDNQGQITAIQDREGDGTVPILSALSLIDEPGIAYQSSLDLKQHRNLVVSGIQHGDACNHDRIREIAKRVVLEILK